METDVVVETPEQIGIRFEVAGFGSRFAAAVLDGLCMVVLLLAAILIPLVALDSGPAATERIAENVTEQRSPFSGVHPVVAIVILVSLFVVMWGYYIIAELVTDGRSPGKRAVGLRVVRTDGLPIGFTESVIRNLVRIIDILPGVYGVGLVAVLATARSQRLGDLAAGTIVVKDRAGQRIAEMPAPDALPVPIVAAPASALTTAERELVERFLARRLTLDDAARAQLARSIAAPIRARLGEAGEPSDEAFLLAVVAPR